MNKIRFLEVGYGGIGSRWCATIEDNSACEIIGIVDIDGEMRDRAQTDTGYPVFSSIEQAQETMKAQAVVIATPSFAHASNIKQALEQGLNVLVEKPFSLNLEAAWDLVQQAEEENLILMVSQNYRYSPEARRLRQLIQCGQIGQPEFVQIQGFNLADAEGRSYRCKLANPHLWEMAVHHFDLLRFLFDTDATAVTCVLFNPSWSWYEGPAATCAWVELDNGVKVNYMGTYVTRGPQSAWPGVWRIEGEDGALLWNDPPEIPLQYTDEAESALQPLAVPALAEVNLAGVLEELVQAISNGRVRDCSGRDNLKTLAMCAACELSAQQQRPVKLSEII